MNTQAITRPSPVVPDMDTIVADLESTTRACKTLMQTKHYSALGEAGIFAVLQKAKSIGMNPVEALNGSMYFVQGKVELTANAMNYLIRSAGHSVVKDPKSDGTICILHGKRADNGDKWQCSFSLQDAQTAGIYRNQWLKYPEDMCFARALSRLARQLFPDVIKGCYVEGEISQAPPMNEVVQTMEVIPSPAIVTITENQAEALDELIGEDAVYRKSVMAYLKKHCGGATQLAQLPVDSYDKIYQKALKNRDDMLAKMELVQPEDEISFAEAEHLAMESLNEYLRKQST